MIKQSPSTEVRKTLPPPGAARGERGFVMVTFVVLAVVLLGMTGLVIDAGMMAYEKRRAQVAADAAAMGGALEIAGGGNGVLAAADDATANGFTGGVNGTTVAPAPARSCNCAASPSGWCDRRSACGRQGQGMLIFTPTMKFL